ncbi:unnamed protein product, partial [Rotaria sp. Silwood1]
MIGSNDDEDDATFEIDMKKDQTPYYLSLNNTLFLRTSKDILKNVQTITINDIQQIAILMHQIGALKIKIDQTNIYLKAVTGTLTEPESDLIDVDRRVWPMQVQSMMSSKSESNSVTTTESNHEKTQRDCENLLHQRLQETSQQIQEAESTYFRYQYQFDAELAKLWRNHRNLVKDQCMTTGLITLLEKRFNNIVNRWRDIYNYRTDYYLKNSYDELKSLKHNETEQSMKITTPSCSLMIDTMNPFNERQLQLLSRGPTYVPPCLMYILFADQSINDIAKKQFAPLKHQLMILFQNYKINLPLRMEIQDKLFNKFENLFAHPIPAQLFQRAVYEKHLIQSIRYTLQKNNLILRRTADNMNTFYIGNRSEFEAKADQYLIRSENYDVLIDINNQNNEKPLHTALKNMMESMNSLLEKLKAHNAIKDELYKQLVADPTKTKLPYLYFLADISNEKIYTFVKGSSNTMPLTETLSNVYLSVWEKKILKEMNTTIEFFGRHKNQLFFTWNKSSPLELETCIEDLREKHRNVRFQKLIGTSVHYLNIYLENRQGHLYSRIHYDPNSQRYTLPYVTSHAKSAYSDWLRTALIRAVCVCTSIDDFQQERMYLELTFLTS